MYNAGAMRTKTGWLLASTPIVLLLTHYAAVLPHEFMHSIVAWLLGIKDQPGNIDWGGSSLLNILLLWNIYENVDYTAALDAGKGWAVALVAFAGPGLVNGGLYLLSRFMIKSPRIAGRPWVVFVLFWFYFINLANMYCYIPIRAFASDGDVHHFLLGTGISPWVPYVVVGYLVLWALIDGYRVVLPYVLRVCGFESRETRAAMLIMATALMFAYYAIPGLKESDAVSLFISRSSVLIVPLVVALNWRRIVLADAPPRSVRAPVEQAVTAPVAS